MGYRRQYPRVLYRNPPVVESVFEVRFSPLHRAVLVSGLFYSRIKERFPEIDSLSLRLGPLALEPMGPSQGMVRYVNHDRTLLCQVEPGRFSVSCTPPYRGFEILKESFLALWPEYLESVAQVGESKRLEIVRLGLRNINRLEFAADSIDLSEYFNLGFFAPPILGGDGWALESFNVVTQFAYGEARGVRLALRSEQGSPIILFDLDCYSVGNFQEVDPGWLDESHEIVGDLFEDSLTDKMKGSFCPEVAAS